MTPEKLDEYRELVKFGSHLGVGGQALKLLLDHIDALDSALRALGVCGEGYCFCATHRDPAKADHTGECVEARRALGEAT